MNKLLLAVVLFAATTSVVNAQDFIFDEGGSIILRGSYPQLHSIVITSLEGNLSRDSYEILPGVILPNRSHEPFPFGTAVFSSQTPYELAYSVGVENAISIEGSTRTAALYRTEEATCGDLFVAVGIGGDSLLSAVPLAYCLPEPTTGGMAVLSLVGLLSVRQRRQPFDE